MKAFGNNSKSDIYPKRPVLGSHLQSDLSEQALLEVETFDSPPGELPWVSWDEARVVVNTSQTLLSLIVDFETEQWASDLEPMGVIVLPAGMNSKWTWTSQADCLVLTIPQPVLIAVASRRGIGEDETSPLQAFCVFKSRTITLLANELVSICESFFDERSVSYEALSKAIIVMLLREVTRVNAGERVNIDVSNVKSLSYKGTLQADVVTYLAANYQAPISVDDLARESGKSRAHFSRMFKGETGLSPAKFITRFRVEKAMKLLLMGGLSISEIAAQCGFYDPSHFTRCFKREVGSTPRNYQKPVN